MVYSKLCAPAYCLNIDPTCIFSELAIFVALAALVGTVLANVCTDAGLTTTDGFIPHPTNCSMYISCYGGQPFEVACPVGYNFNPELLKCDSKYVCVENTCPPTGIVYQPVEGSCTDYTLCIGGAAYPQQCEAGLSFDPATLKCIPAEEAQCVDNECDPAIPPPQFFVNPFDCTIFFICDENFLPVEFQCANGTIFDTAVNDCVLGDTCPVRRIF